MVTVLVYEYPDGSRVADDERPPAKARLCVSRTIWVFEVRAETRLCYSLRRVVEQIRVTTRSKWKNHRGWYWNRGDVTNPRMLPDSHWIKARPEIPESVRACAVDAIVHALVFEPDR